MGRYLLLLFFLLCLRGFFLVTCGALSFSPLILHVDFDLFFTSGLSRLSLFESCIDFFFKSGPFSKLKHTRNMFFFFLIIVIRKYMVLAFISQIICKTNFVLS